ncbi:hypothetical protein B0H17DRAFT_1206549 [Mycena rosella]|uniref:Uncharacterized protein n=1 Tax=Mycena rosella TaxID=1033263 RepID=A0AAD7GBE1_MYCRO|nr:hypothetical protein B0H17DRAFT_1206549 [Mycena rosella]
MAVLRDWPGRPAVEVCAGAASRSPPILMVPARCELAGRPVVDVLRRGRVQPRRCATATLCTRRCRESRVSERELGVRAVYASALVARARGDASVGCAGVAETWSGLCRWGDAPVHSIAAGLFASKDQIQFFEEIGYEHNPYTHCPKDPGMWERGRCGCDPQRSFDYDGVFFFRSELHSTPRCVASSLPREAHSRDRASSSPQLPQPAKRAERKSRRLFPKHSNLLCALL